MSGEMAVYTPERVDLIKRTIAKGASDDELALFIAQCKRTGLDPFARQIYCIQRRAQDEGGQWVAKMETQVSIDGLRLVADRTQTYCPGREPTYAHDKEGRLVSATAYVRKLVGGTWHEVAATAHYLEYVQTKRDGHPTKFWATKPHIMLAKCAEALALRKAFPMDLSGLYTPEEIGSEPPAGPVQIEAAPAPSPRPALEHKPNGDSPGDPPVKGDLKPPQTGKELYQRLVQKQAQLEGAGKLPAGSDALLEHVIQSGVEREWPADLGQWDAAQARAGYAWARDWVQQRELASVSAAAAANVQN